MNQLDLRLLLNDTVTVAQQAGALLQGMFGNIRADQVSTKSSPVDLVSIADRQAEEMVRAGLASVLPSAAFFGEETSKAQPRANSGLCWVVDPLDGTSNFLAGLPIWSTSIALCTAELTPLIGVVHAPTFGKTWSAYSGGGACVNGVPMRVRAQPPGGGLENAMLATGFPYDVSLGRSETTIKYYSKMQSHFQKIRRLGSAAIDLALIAEGVFDGMWELRLREWDTAAGVLLVSEAGGHYSQLDGTPYVPGAPDMLVGATPELLGLMRAVLLET